MPLNAKRERYSESQVLCGLRHVWADTTGTDKDESSFNADTRIDTYLKSDGLWDEIDFADVFWCLEKFFCFTCSEQEWLDFFGFEVARRSNDEWERTIAPSLTFGALSRFIADRAAVIASFDPVTVFGKECGPAGAFTGIQQPISKRIAPSDRIIDVIRGERLDQFWGRLRWLTENSIPELPAIWSNASGAAGCLATLLAISGVIASLSQSNISWAASGIASAVAIYVIAIAYKWLTNPLPDDVATFRDLSNLIAGNRN